MEWQRRRWRPRGWMGTPGEVSRGSQNRGHRCLSSADQLLNGLEEMQRAEGLFDVAIGSGCHSGLTIGAPDRARQHDHGRRVEAQALYALADFDPAPIWQRDVQNRDGWSFSVQDG